MTSLRRVFLLIQSLGVDWVWFRIRYALRRKSGGLRRASPVATWEQIAAPSGAGLELKTRSVTPTPRGSTCVAEADAILAGRFILFSGHEVEAGVRPEWHRNWLSSPAIEGGASGAPALRSGLHWSEYGDFSFGDIKGVWELSRFTWAYPLARAYAHTGEERYAEGFWRLFEDWLQHNPPNTGPNWMCGQEATFRLMAVTFACEQCASAQVTTKERVGKFQSFVLATGRRITANLDYALSQSNNHGVSECVGLITAASLLPSDRASEAWKRRGLRELERQLDELVYPDGGFSQHSAIYHRVLLDDLLWVVSRLRQSGQEVPAWLSEAGGRSVAFIAALMNPDTGRVPLYGANDGAQVLPLADADFLDFRPVVQAGFHVFHGRRFLPEGPWDEKAAWLEDGGQRAEDGGRIRATRVPDAPLRPPASDFRLPTSGSAQHFPDAGCLSWQSGEARLFFRCPTHFRHRPSQADLLHVELEWRGHPIAHDAGTYSYNPGTGQPRDSNAPTVPGSPARERRDRNADPSTELPPLTPRATGKVGPTFKVGAFSVAAVHNALTFDGEEPMEKVGRFLYLPWPKGQADWDGENVFEATHDGWGKFGLTHHRRVSTPGPNSFVVTDMMAGSGRHRGRLHWLLADLPHAMEADQSRLVLRSPAGDYAVSWSVPTGSVSLVRADPGSARGWWSPLYSQAKPALSLAVEFEFSGECRIETRFSPA